MVHPSLVTRGGAENAVVWLATELAGRGHEVTVFTTDFDEGLFGPAEAQPFRLRLMPHAGRYALNRTMRVRWRQTAEILARELPGFDLVNPHNFPAYIWVWMARQGSATLPPAIWYAEDFGFHSHVVNVQGELPDDEILRATDLPRRLWSHFWERPGGQRLRAVYRLFRMKQVARFLEPLDREAVHGLDMVLTNSDFSTAWLERLYGRSARTCHLGMPPDRFAADAPPPSDEMVSCSITRLFPAKNVATTLDALALLRDDPALAAHVHYVIGEGPQLEDLRRRADALGLGARVVFTGFPVPSLSEYLARSRAFVHIPLDEPFGLVYLEASVLGVPSVASSSGGPAEIVLHGQTGLTADPRDPRAVADALRTLLLDPALARTLGSAARQRARSVFSIGAMADRFMASVDECLATRGAGPSPRPPGTPAGG